MSIEDAAIVLLSVLGLLVIVLSALSLLIWIVNAVLKGCLRILKRLEPAWRAAASYVQERLAEGPRDIKSRQLRKSAQRSRRKRNDRRAPRENAQGYSRKRNDGERKPRPFCQPLNVIMTRSRGLIKIARNPYRPELHYMRGPGPKWYAKHQGRTENGPR
jgi:hypothetical protein